MSLYLMCKSCGRQFSAGVDAPPPEPRPHECYYCHASPVYEPPDFLVPEGYGPSQLEGLTSHG